MDIETLDSGSFLEHSLCVRSHALIYDIIQSVKQTYDLCHPYLTDDNIESQGKNICQVSE